MAVLNKTWGSLDHVTQPESAVVTGESEEGTPEAAAAALLPKPLMIYVTDGTDLGEYDKIEKIVLMDDKVCVGMWAFDCVKMTPENVAEDETLSKKWKEDGRGFIFVSRDMKKIDVVGMRKMSAKTVFKAMKKQAKRAYKANFEKNIKSVIKVLGEFDKINNQRGVLADKQKRAEDKKDKKAIEGIRKDLKELDAVEKDMTQKRDDLLKFPLKDVKVA